MTTPTNEDLRIYLLSLLSLLEPKPQPARPNFSLTDRLLFGSQAEDRHAKMWEGVPAQYRWSAIGCHPNGFERRRFFFPQNPLNIDIPVVYGHPAPNGADWFTWRGHAYAMDLTEVVPR